MNRDQVEKQIRSKLTPEEVRQAYSVGFAKLSRASMRIYNNCCMPCKRKILANPKLSLDAYCEPCGEFANKTIRELLLQ